jgi:membrane-associated two-gene conflict system component 1 (EACC1)
MIFPESDGTRQDGRAAVENGARGQTRLSLVLSRTDGSEELRALRDLLSENGAENVKLPVLGDPVPGRRGGESGISDVVATLTPGLGLVARIVNTLRGWLAVRPQRTIDLTIGDASIKITGLSSKNEDKMVEAFVRRVSGAADAHG